MKTKLSYLVEQEDLAIRLQKVSAESGDFEMAATAKELQKQFRKQFLEELATNDKDKSERNCFIELVEAREGKTWKQLRDEWGSLFGMLSSIARPENISSELKTMNTDNTNAQKTAEYEAMIERVIKSVSNQLRQLMEGSEYTEVKLPGFAIEKEGVLPYTIEFHRKEKQQ